MEKMTLEGGDLVAVDREEGGYAVFVVSDANGNIDYRFLKNVALMEQASAMAGSGSGRTFYRQGYFLIAIPDASYDGEVIWIYHEGGNKKFGAYTMDNAMMIARNANRALDGETYPWDCEWNHLKIEDRQKEARRIYG